MSVVKVIPTFFAMLAELKQSSFKALASLGRTLGARKDEVARMWRFSKSNGITEGFHRKMKLIQRRAYGFRNFENYRVRVRVLCG
uniref:transposase n=1 Tax=Legionella longbeachae TaxID=450 RepID=UPI0029823DA1|nr:transposase [Legionella longbeachae]